MQTHANAQTDLNYGNGTTSNQKDFEGKKEIFNGRQENEPLVHPLD